MPRLIVLALLLAGCAATAPAPGLRDTGQPIRSAVLFDPARIAGDWHEVATLGTPGCAPGAVRVAADGGALRLDGRLCGQGKLAARAVPAGPGRLALSGQTDPWWVLWVDDGYRTLVIGTPSGAFAHVLDRGRLPPDRLAAVRTVLEFNGYNATALVPR
jgi:apolipoprotein D and lipocalin family protein